MIDWCFFYLSESTKVTPEPILSAGTRSPGYEVKPQMETEHMVYTKTERINNEGGKVSLDELDMSIKIPQGALSSQEGIGISLTVDTKEAHAPLEATQLVLGPVFSCQPDGQIFDYPVTICVPHSGLNIKPACVQVWRKASTTPSSESSWQKVFDGSEEEQESDTQVSVIGNKIKIRVRRFSIYDILTAGITKIKTWVYPELQLDIWAYMIPVTTIADSQRVLVKMYALRTNDESKKESVKRTEERDDESGMCIRQSSFPLRPNGNDLTVKIKRIDPEKWIPLDGFTSNIAYRDIQAGGVAAGCDIIFRRDEQEHAKTLEGAFILSQYDNANTVERRINFWDRTARQDIKARAIREVPQVRQQDEAQGERGSDQRQVLQVQEIAAEYERGDDQRQQDARNDNRGRGKSHLFKGSNLIKSVLREMKTQGQIFYTIYAILFVILNTNCVNE